MPFAPPEPMLVRVTFRLLAPAGPVRPGRLATVRASLGSNVAEGLTWDWDDGHRDEGADTAAGVRRARRTHRYALAGVYRVRVNVGDLIDQALVRYVAVAQPGQVAGSGWVNDPEQRDGVPFGLLLTPRVEGAAEALVFRSLMPAGEVTSTELTWLIVGGPASLHFGGQAAVDGRCGIHPFRVDLHGGVAPGRRARQELAISLYAPSDVPGRDSPIERITGLVRPGLIDISAYLPPATA